MRRTLLTLTLVVLMAAGSVRGETGQPLTPKSPNAATAWSLMGTVVPTGFGIVALSSNPEGTVALVGTVAFFGGTIVGPGLGHDYAEAKGRFWLGVGLRTAGWVGTTVAVALTWDNSDSAIGAAAGFGSLGLIAVSMLYDIGTASRSAEKYNEKHGLQTISLEPTFNPGDGTAGLQLSMAF